MKTKYVRVPFDVEMAKRIQNKECAGSIITRVGGKVRNVVFDLKNEECPICAIVETDIQKEDVILYLKDGSFRKGCTDDFDLMLEILEYMKYKDGDVLYAETKDGNRFIFIKKNSELKTYKYVSLNNGQRLSFVHTECCNDECLKILRFASESEKQRLVEALKESKETADAKACLKMLGVEVKPECEFKPFDKVLARDSKSNEWKIDIFREFTADGGSEGYRYNCFYDNWNYCIPYNDQTKHLLGTTNNWEK